MSSSIEPDLKKLILKYGLAKFIGKFEKEGITSYERIQKIDLTRLRSYYNMLQAEVTNFEDLRSECIQISENLDEHNILEPPISLHAYARSLPVHIDSSDISPAYENSGPVAIGNSAARLVGDAPNNIQDGAYLLDYDTERERAVGEFKMKGNRPCIQTFPDQVIIQDETLLCHFYSQIPFCELKMKNRTPYVLPVDNKENVEQIISNISRSQENFGSARPDIPRYDGALVDGYKGLGIIIAYNHMDEDIENRNAISDAFTMLFQKMNLKIVYVNDKTKASFTATLKSAISEAVKILMKIFFIGIFSYRQDQEGAKVQLQNSDFIGINEVFMILKENIPTKLPKGIIIQACHSGINTKMNAESRLDMNKPYNASIMESNYLVVYSNVGVPKEQKESFWYIHSLIGAYNEMQDQSDFYHVLVRANQLMLMRKSSPDVHKKPAQIESTFSRHLYV